LFFPFFTFGGLIEQDYLYPVKCSSFNFSFSSLNSSDKQDFKESTGCSSWCRILTFVFSGRRRNHAPWGILTMHFGAEVQEC
jgi:hypothetical protein